MVSDISMADSGPSRNTLSQRRTRARQKAYITTLEEKVARLEQQSQKWNQRELELSVRCRELEVKVSELEGYVHRLTSYTIPFENQDNHARQTEERSLLPQQNVKQEPPISKPRKRKPKAKSQQTASGQSSLPVPLLPEANATKLIQNSIKLSYPASPNLTVMRSVPRETPSSPNAIPCETAALIIANMRHSFTDDVRTQLGCTTDQSCNVGTMRVMEFMDMDYR
jgi:hypothetical protein